jgi:DNA-binding LacI/PurR family transcriptional regulator/anti-anti-sigma regulatory factor
MPDSFTLGILSPLLGNFYYGQLLRGIQQVAGQRGARAIAIPTRDAWSPYGEYGRSREESHPLAWEHVDGWIAITDAVVPTYLHTIRQAGKPLVLLSWRLPDIECPVILPDNHGGARQLVRHLVEHGHTRIGFAGFIEHTDIGERYEGYRAALIEHGLTPDPALYFAADDNQSIGGRTAAERILAAGVPCTAVMTGTDLNALALIETLQRAGVRVPEDVAVVGFDDIDPAQYGVPALTTARQRFEGLGRAAAELLLAQLAGEDVPNDLVRVPCPLIVRRSCGCTEVPAFLTARLDAPADVGWQEWLAAELVRLALSPVPPPPNVAPSEIWPSVGTLVEGAAAAIAGTPGPSEQELANAWREALVLTTELRTLNAMVALLTDLAQLQVPPGDAEARARLDRFLNTVLSDMLHARLRAEIGRSTHFETIILNNYDITSAVLEGEAHNARDLDWLPLTSATQGCLGLWDSAESQLTVAGVFNRAGGRLKAGSALPPQHFPPAELLQAFTSGIGGEMPMLFPVRSPQRDWGILAVVGPVEATLGSGRSIFSQSAALLTIALEREELVQSLVTQQLSLRDAYDRELILAATIREISTPIIPLLPHVLLIPLIGTLDTARAHQLIETVLYGVSGAQATEVLLDLTGVPLVDTQVAGALIQVTRAAMLLGAHVILVGVRPEIAQSLVSLGIDLSFVGTEATLSAAVERLIRRRNAQKEQA